MSITKVLEKEHGLIVKAQNSICKDELTLLSKNPFSNVRRCVARNENTPKHIVDLLACDPVCNVLYVALKNPLCSVERDMDEFVNKCIVCEKDEAIFRHECQICNEASSKS